MSIKAIWISSEGFSTSFRERTSGIITSVNSLKEKDTNGMSLIQLATAAKQAHFDVEVFTEEELNLMDKRSFMEEDARW